MRRVFVLACVLLASCGLELVGSLGAGDDAGAPDGSPPATDGALEDSNTAEDGGVDAPVSNDANAPVVPSHVDASVDLGAADLSGATVINTSTRTVMIGPQQATVKFEPIGDATVLFVGAWSVNVPVRIDGTKSLIVVAAKAVTISAGIDAAAIKEVPGPGGFGPTLGPGKGTSGIEGSGSDSTGAGGAGFGTAGAKGGNTNSGDVGADGGPAYGASIDAFLGGSGGGHGSPFGNCGIQGSGGGGGGALQITSAVSITVAQGVAIGVGGGGGKGGCENGSSGTMSGGGGGSGGMIFLEAPAITVEGALAANGGGGGGSASNGNGSGQDGNNGGLTLAVATGGSGPFDVLKGGSGGAGTTLPSIVQTGTSNGAGGGGAVGRIWLRTRGAQLTLGGQHVVSPDAGLDTTL